MKPHPKMRYVFDAEQSDLRQRYMAWLGSTFPDGRGKMVAGQSTRKGIAQGEELMAKTIPIWNELARAWQQGGRVWVWSDHHLFHKNICRYGERPFETLDQMHQTMIDRAQMVRPDEFLLFGGDLSFSDLSATRDWMRQIPGRKVLLLGNHDVDRQKLHWMEKVGVEAIADCLYLPKNQGAIWLTHYPMGKDTLAPGVINVHGHIHQKSIDGYFLNMCVEHTDYAPMDLRGGVGI